MDIGQKVAEFGKNGMESPTHGEARKSRRRGVMQWRKLQNCHFAKVKFRLIT
jgi:hypothetical protein